MSAAHTKLEIINESPKSSHTTEMGPNDLELIFGAPTSPKNIRNSNLNHNENHHSKPSSIREAVPYVDPAYTLTQPHHNGNHISEAERTSQPLLEPDREKQKPPLAGPEIDDLDDEVAAHNNNKPFPGIDDGLLEPIDNKPDIIDVGDESHDEDGNNGQHDGDDSHTEDGKWPWPSGDEPDGDYDHTRGLTPRFGLDDRPISPIPSSIDVNTYQQKKNLAQGMMDLALLSANANQLRYVLESASTHPYYYSSLVFISLSIIFQIAVGVGLIMNSRYDVNDKKEICKADKINNFTVLGIFLITIVNVFITSFSVATNTAVGAASATVPAG